MSDTSNTESTTVKVKTIQEIQDSLKEGRAICKAAQNLVNCLNYNHNAEFLTHHPPTEYCYPEWNKDYHICWPLTQVNQTKRLACNSINPTIDDSIIEEYFKTTENDLIRECQYNPVTQKAEWSSINDRKCVEANMNVLQQLDTGDYNIQDYEDTYQYDYDTSSILNSENADTNFNQTPSNLNINDYQYSDDSIYNGENTVMNDDYSYYSSSSSNLPDLDFSNNSTTESMLMLSTHNNTNPSTQFIQFSLNIYITFSFISLTAIICALFLFCMIPNKCIRIYLHINLLISFGFKYVTFFCHKFIDDVREIHDKYINSADRMFMEDMIWTPRNKTHINYKSIQEQLYDFMVKNGYMNDVANLNSHSLQTQSLPQNLQVITNNINPDDIINSNNNNLLSTNSLLNDTIYNVTSTEIFHNLTTTQSSILNSTFSSPTNTVFNSSHNLNLLENTHHPYTSNRSIRSYLNSNQHGLHENFTVDMKLTQLSNMIDNNYVCDLIQNDDTIRLKQELYTISLQYTILSNHAWACIEGLYLFMLYRDGLITSNILRKSPVFFISLGWGVPAFFVTLWTLTWKFMDGTDIITKTEMSWYDIIYIQVPLLLSTIMNLLIVIYIISDLRKKLNVMMRHSLVSQGLRNQTHSATGSVGTTTDSKTYFAYQTKVKLTRATMSLIPLLGLHYFITVILSSCDENFVKKSIPGKMIQLVEVILGSIQGFLVAFLYGLASREVKHEMKTRWDKILTNASLNKDAKRRGSSHKLLPFGRTSHRNSSMKNPNLNPNTSMVEISSDPNSDQNNRLLNDPPGSQTSHNLNININLNIDNGRGTGYISTLEVSIHKRDRVESA